jgi:hypothetical protein
MSMSSSDESYCGVLDNLLLSADYGIVIMVNMVPNSSVLVDEIANKHTVPLYMISNTYSMKCGCGITTVPMIIEFYCGLAVQPAA